MKEFSDYSILIKPLLDTSTLEKGINDAANLFERSMSEKLSMSFSRSPDEMFKKYKEYRIQYEADLLKYTSLDQATKHGTIGSKEDLDDWAKASRAVEASKSAKNIALANTMFKALSSSISSTIDLFSKMYETGNKVIEVATRYSNEYFTSSSIFMKGSASKTRDTMLKYGIDTTSAIGLNTAMSQMGISESDFGYLTNAQQETLMKLMNLYKEGMSNIDPEKMERYNDAVNKYQLMQAEFSIKIKTAITELLANSDALPELLDNAGQLISHIVDILSSPTTQWVFDTFISFLNNFFMMLEKMTGWLANITGGSGGTTNNNTTNIYTSDATGVNDIINSIGIGSNLGF